jgi:hypothetical protein
VAGAVWAAEEAEAAEHDRQIADIRAVLDEDGGSNG